MANALASAGWVLIFFAFLRGLEVIKLSHKSLREWHGFIGCGKTLGAREFWDLNADMRVFPKPVQPCRSEPIKTLALAPEEAERLFLGFIMKWLIE
jgi:hypothetical protein